MCMICYRQAYKEQLSSKTDEELKEIAKLINLECGELEKEILIGKILEVYAQ